MARTQELKRCFLALSLPPEIKNQITDGIAPFKKNFSHHRFISKENQHITLHFFGAISHHDIAKAGQALRPSLPAIDPFYVSLSRLSVFPSRKKPNMLWIEVDQGSSEIAYLKGGIDSTLDCLGFKIEKRVFHPHVTIARIAKKFSPHKIGQQELCLYSPTSQSAILYLNR
jgi:RNA 2',3'-cyclic 3'-phosphodiesterase